MLTMFRQRSLALFTIAVHCLQFTQQNCSFSLHLFTHTNFALFIIWCSRTLHCLSDCLHNTTEPLIVYNSSYTEPCIVYAKCLSVQQLSYCSISYRSCRAHTSCSGLILEFSSSSSTRWKSKIETHSFRTSSKRPAMSFAFPKSWRHSNPDQNDPRTHTHDIPRDTWERSCFNISRQHPF